MLAPLKYHAKLYPEWEDNRIRFACAEGTAAYGRALVREGYMEPRSPVEPSREERLERELRELRQRTFDLEKQISQLLVPNEHEAFRPQRIAIAVAEKHGMTLKDLRSQRRNRNFVQARHEAIWRVHEGCPLLSLPQIGRIFKRDHTTILYAIRKFAGGSSHTDNTASNSVCLPTGPAPE